MHGTVVRWPRCGRGAVAAVCSLGALLAVAPSATALESMRPITDIQIAWVTDPDESADEACKRQFGDGYYPVRDQDDSPTDLQAGEPPTGPGGYVYPRGITEPSQYLCLEFGDGPPLRKLYPVAGDGTTGRQNCFDGDIRLEADMQAYRQPQKEYLCFSYIGGRPLTDVKITTVAPPTGGFSPEVEPDRIYTFQEPNLGKEVPRTLNLGGPLQYLYTRHDQQHKYVWGCGGENESACPWYTRFNNSGRPEGCDTGLKRDSSWICRNHDRRTTLNQSGNLGYDFSGSDEQWALENQLTELGFNEPVNWSTIVGTHNSFANWIDGEITDPNHTLSLTDQLRGGARALGLDLHFLNGELRVCHGALCLPTHRQYSAAIKEIAAWLDEHPREVIVIKLEDSGGRSGDAYSQPFNDEWANDPLQVYFGNRVFRPRDCDAVVPDCSWNRNWTDIPRWPTRRELLDHGKQVIVFTDNDWARGFQGDHWDPWMWQEGHYFWPALRRASRVDYGNCKWNDLSPKLWDPVNGGSWDDKGLTAIQTWTGTSEDRTDTGSRGAYAGLIDEERARRLAQCNVGLIELDMLHAAWWSKDRNDGPCELGNQEDLADPCPKPDRRVARTVWSWLTRPEADDRYAVQRAGGGWFGESDPSHRVQHHFACAPPRGDDPATTKDESDPRDWPDKSGQLWWVTSTTGKWHEGHTACQALGKSLTPERTLEFSVPRNGVMAQTLDDALTRARGTSGFDGSSQLVWLNYSKLADGRWRILPPGGAPSVQVRDFPAPEAIDDGYAARDVRLVWSVTGGKAPHEWQYEVTGPADFRRSGGCAGSACDRGHAGTFANPGLYVFSLTGEDALGTPIEHRIQFVIDHTSPKLTLAGIPDKPTSQPVTPRLTVEEEHPGTEIWKLNGGVIEAGSRIASEGRHNLSITVTDAADNATTVARQFVIDLTAPILAADIDPRPNFYGWNKSHVTVRLLPFDPLSGVVAVRWCAGSSPPSAPCEETFASEVEVPVSDEGDTYILYQASNGAALAARRIVRIRIDTVAPTIEADRPSPNQHGWYRAPVTFKFTCSDDAAGVQSCWPPTTLSGEGRDQRAQARASDRADNEAILTVDGINIDMTPPTVSCDATPRELWPPNRDLRAVATDVSVTDSLSGPGRFVLRSAASDQPDETSGRFVGDIRGFDLGTADTVGQLRAERTVVIGDRTYTLGYDGWDLAGNSSECVAHILVPERAGGRR